jgi:uncharacterized protein YegP (UPF0339 family)
MKANIRDQYDFEQPSPSQKPGFEVFYSDKHKAWFFHGNDVNGKAILFSQAYNTPENVEKGLQSALKNIEKGRIYKRTEGGQFFLNVVAGNNQEVGRSPFFKKENIADNNLSFLKQVAKSSDPIISKETPILPIETTETILDETPSRRSFRLYFYKNEDNGNRLNGRIEDIANEKATISFQGIDTPAIIGFIKQQLSSDWVEQEDKVAIVEQIVEQKVVEEPIPNESKAAQKSNIIEQKIKPEREIVLKNENSMSFTLLLDDQGIYEDGNVIGSEMIAMNADTQQKVQLQNLYSQYDTFNRKILLKYSTSNILISSTYHFESTVWFKDANQEILHFRATCWAYIL